jgi:hypothetical protein
MFMRPDVLEEDDEETAGTKRAAPHGGRVRQPGSRIPRLSGGELASVTSLLQRFTNKLREGARDAADIPFAMWRFEQAVCTVLPRLVLQVPPEDTEHRARLIESLHAAWADAFSIDGVAYGKPRGWMVRAWASPLARQTLDDALADSGRAARFVAAFAVSLAFVHAGEHKGQHAPPRDHSSMAGVAAGLRVITGVDDLFDHAQWNADVRERITNYTLNADGVIADSAVVDSARVVVGEEVSVLRDAARWWPLAALEQARARGESLAWYETSLEHRDAPLFAAYRRQRGTDRTRVTAAAMSVDRGRVLCHACESTQSVVHSDAIRSVAIREPLCEGCSRILIPFTFDDPVTIAILARLMPPDASTAPADGMTAAPGEITR